MIMGTPRYMAPEAVKGETVDARSDLFAAGAILFEMLAGRPAFDGRTIADVIHATVYEQPPALERLVDGRGDRSRHSSGAGQAAVGSTAVGGGDGRRAALGRRRSTPKPSPRRRTR